MTQQTSLTELARFLGDRAGQGRRTICAIAGAPGSGKSTLAEGLVKRLNEGTGGLTPEVAALLPMDGFHFDDLHLDQVGLRSKKGAPETFDVGGLRHALLRLRAADESFVAVPVFDRGAEIARAGARLIPRGVPVVVTEGNWLLLDQAPWGGLKSLFDVTVMIDTPEEVLRARLRRRWDGYGLADHEIARKLDGNDLPNGRLVRHNSVPADFVLAQEA